MTNFFQQSESDAADDNLEAILQEATGRTISLNPKDYVNSNLLTWPEVLERIELGLPINEGEILPPIPSGLTATEFYNATGISATTFSQPPFSDFSQAVTGSSAVSTPTTTSLQTAEQTTTAQQVRIGQRNPSGVPSHIINPETDADEHERQEQRELDNILGYGKDTGLKGLIQGVLGLVAPYGTGMLFQTPDSPMTVMGDVIKEWWTGTPSGWEEHATLNNAAQVWAALDKGIITEQQANAFYTNGPGRYYADGAGAIGDKWERPNEDQIRGASGLYDKDFHTTGGVGSVDPLLGLDSDYMPLSIEQLVERNRQALYTGSEAPRSGIPGNLIGFAGTLADGVGITSDGKYWTARSGFIGGINWDPNEKGDEALARSWKNSLQEQLAEVRGQIPATPAKRDVSLRPSETEDTGKPLGEMWPDPEPFFHPSDEELGRIIGTPDPTNISQTAIERANLPPPSGFSSLAPAGVTRENLDTLGFDPEDRELEKDLHMLDQRDMAADTAMLSKESELEKDLHTLDKRDIDAEMRMLSGSEDPRFGPPGTKPEPPRLGAPLQLTANSLRKNIETGGDIAAAKRLQLEQKAEAERVANQKQYDKWQQSGGMGSYLLEDPSPQAYKVRQAGSQEDYERTIGIGEDAPGATHADPGPLTGWEGWQEAHAADPWTSDPVDPGPAATDWTEAGNYGGYGDWGSFYQEGGEVSNEGWQSIMRVLDTVEKEGGTKEDFVDLVTRDPNIEPSDLQKAFNYGMPGNPGENDPRYNPDLTARDY